jgi:hypothetical protein
MQYDQQFHMRRLFGHSDKRVPCLATTCYAALERDALKFGALKQKR